MQLVYAFLYVCLVTERVDSNYFQQLNNDVIEILQIHELVSENHDPDSNEEFPNKYSSYDELSSLEEVGDWLEGFSESLISQPRVVPHATLIHWEVPMYYLTNELNYIITQSYILCFEVYEMGSLKN